MEKTQEQKSIIDLYIEKIKEMNEKDEKGMLHCIEDENGNKTYGCYIQPELNPKEKNPQKE